MKYRVEQVTVTRNKLEGTDIATSSHPLHIEADDLDTVIDSIKAQYSVVNLNVGIMISFTRLEDIDGHALASVVGLSDMAEVYRAQYIISVIFESN